MAAKGSLILRNEDLDRGRCRPEFVSAMLEDLRWFGFRWQEGPDCGGPFGPYSQSQRTELYRAAFEKLRAAGFIYPCTCSRQDVRRALLAPHAGEDEPIYPGTCRPKTSSGAGVPPVNRASRPRTSLESATDAGETPEVTGGTPEVTGETPAPLLELRQPSLRINWRFRVPDAESICFVDLACGPQQFMAGRDFGDFVVWRHDEMPSYHLAVVVDDAAMQITEVVRGEDLLKSTGRQLLLYRALDLQPPQFFHCPLLTDESGKRLAKRHDALSLRALREKGISPERLRNSWNRHSPDTTLQNLLASPFGSF